MRCYNKKTEFDLPTIRRLRKGETVEFHELGIPNVYLSGSGIRVAEYPDGSKSVVLPPLPLLEMLEKFVFAELVICDCGSLDKSEVYYLRRMMNMTQQQLADLLDLTRETISRLENGKEKISTTVALAIQRLCIPQAVEFLNHLPAEVRKLNRANFARFQDFLARKHTETIHLADNIHFSLACPRRVGVLA